MIPILKNYIVIHTNIPTEKTIKINKTELMYKCCEKHEYTWLTKQNQMNIIQHIATK